ncbi:putative membrane protein [Streptococcus sanguinis]|nr:putative membrane protein [Streptococcus sanguinis]
MVKSLYLFFDVSTLFAKQLVFFIILVKFHLNSNKGF